jgi:hypothetical protein
MLYSSVVGKVYHKDTFHVKNFEKRCHDIIIIGMGNEAIIYNITNGMSERYKERAVSILMRDMGDMNRIANNATDITKSKKYAYYIRNNGIPSYGGNIRSSIGTSIYEDVACSLCNNDAEYEYSNKLHVCDVCHLSFLVGKYGKADISYEYNICAEGRTDGIYYTNNERTKIIYAHGNNIHEYITIRADMLYTKWYYRALKDVKENNIKENKSQYLPAEACPVRAAQLYCHICVVNKGSDCGLCYVCSDILREFHWKRVLPYVFIILNRIDDNSQIKLCHDIKRYCLLFLDYRT